MNHPESSYRAAKRYLQTWITIKSETKSIVLIVLGIFSASFGFKGFLLTNHFLDGGVTGISLLISETTKFPVSILIVMINIPFVIMSYFTLGKHFAFKTGFAIIGLGLCLAMVEFPNFTYDKLVVAVFGGIFLGAGIGLTIRGGGVIDGTEVLAIYLSKKIGVTIGDIIIVVNIFIFGSAAFLLSIESALYSLITYFAASEFLDFLIDGIDEYVGVTIISSHSKEIQEMIVNTMGRGVTTYQGKKGIGKRGEREDIDIIYTVITRLEMNKLNVEIEKITPTAFVVMNSVKDTKGGMIKKKVHKY
jgi:uncharacterized membrane-anchored protein YitT (DUF2179 family)